MNKQIMFSIRQIWTKNYIAINTAIKINLMHVKIYCAKDWALNLHRKNKVHKEHYKDEDFKTMNRIFSLDHLFTITF